jgi:4-amino-4-deoxy-L-arabinose transferase-like glycosyltransferase
MMSTNQPSRNRITRHWPLGVVLLLFGLLAVAYHLALPVGEVSDARAHFALVRFIVENRRPPVTFDERVSIGIKGDASPLYHSLAALLTAPVDISALPELPELNDDGRRAIPLDGRMPQGLFHTEDEKWPYQGIVLAWHLAGLLSVPLGMATLVAVYLTALALWPERRWLALAAAAAVAFVPRFIISSVVVNDDNLAIPLITFSVYGMVRLLRGHIGRFTFVLLGAVVGLAAVTKFHGLVLLPELTLVLAYVAWRDGWGWRAAIQRWGVAMLLVALTAGWWLAFVLLNFNQIEAQGVVAGLLAALGDPVIAAGSAGGVTLADPDELGYWGLWIFRNFWLHYNGLDEGMSMVGREDVYWLLYAAYAGLLLLALTGLLPAGWRLWREVTLSPPPTGAGPRSWGLRARSLLPSTVILLFLAGHLLIYAGLVLARFLSFPDWSTAQGRHLYPALVSLSIFFVLGLASWWRRLPRRFGGDAGLAVTQGGVMALLAGLVLPLFLLPVYGPLLPLTSLALESGPGLVFDNDIRLVAANWPTDPITAGQPLPVTLTWQSGSRQEQDRLVELCLRNESGTALACSLGHPAEGRYPLRAWENQYQISDTHSLPVSACLPPGDLRLTVRLRPLRSDQAAPLFADDDEAAPPVELGVVTLAAGNVTAAGHSSLWRNGRRLSPGDTVWQLNQSVTLLTDSPLPPVLRPVDGGPAWEALQPPLVVTCPDGRQMTSATFIAHARLAPGLYQLPNGQPALRLHTRPRSFEPPATGIDTPTMTNFGDVMTLLGYSAQLDPRRPGDTIRVVTVWQAGQSSSRRYGGSVQLLDQNLTGWGQDDRPLGDDYPTTLWAAGEVVRAEFTLPVGGHVAAGQYRLKLNVYSVGDDGLTLLPIIPADAGAAGAPPQADLFLGQVRVLDPARDQEPEIPSGVTLGEQIQLQGADLSPRRLAAGESLALALHWQAQRTPQADYTVFTQLLGPDGRVVAQQDNQPQGGSFPTSTWPPGETVVDRYRLALPADAPAGEYQLLVGMYTLADGQRLPAVDSQGQRLPGDAVAIWPVTVE